jgi:isopentenyl-diphosphate delta-isomerase
MNVKDEQLIFSLKQSLESRSGLDGVRFSHYSLPELDFDEVDASVVFLGERFSAPIIIGSMTGGSEWSGRVNRKLALAAESENIPFSTGSQKVALKNPRLIKTFNVKKFSPSVFLISNIGGSALLDFSFDEIEGSLQAVEADALFVHLNPLQELIQKDGVKRWRGVRGRIEELCDYLSVPVLVKEVGNGLNRRTALELQACGVKGLDVAGFGGTNWSVIESERRGLKGSVFEGWGLSTLESLLECRGLKIPVIGSGGVRSGLDVARVIRLGGSLASASLPFLKAVLEGRLESEIEKWVEELKITMMLTRSKSLKELRKAELLKGGF